MTRKEEPRLTKGKPDLPGKTPLGRPRGRPVSREVEEVAREPHEGADTCRGGRFCQGNVEASGADGAHEDMAIVTGGLPGQWLSAGRVDILMGTDHVLRLVNACG